MKNILLIAFVVYLFLAPLSYHTDNKGVLRWISHDYWTVFNIYDHTRATFGESGTFNYPPMNYFLAKLEWPLAQLVGGDGYYEWLNTNDELAAFSPNIFRYNLATKLPLVLAGIFTGWLLYVLGKKQFQSEERARLLAGLWLFNPIVLYSIPLMGQNDVFAILLFLAGWIVFARYQLWAIVLFGLSISVKMYPLIWLVFLLTTIREWSFVKRFLILGASYGIYFLTTLPFIRSVAFQEAVLKSSINERFFIPQINIGMDETIFIIPILLLLVLVTSYKAVEQRKIHVGGQAWFILLANFTLLGFAHFHPQWFTWMIPFWGLWFASLPSLQEMKRAAWLSVGVFLVWIVALILFKDKFLTWGIISPLNQQVMNMPVLFEFFHLKGFEVAKYVNIAHTILAASAFLLILKSFTNHSFAIDYDIKKFTLPVQRIHIPKGFFLLVPSLILFGLILGSTLIPAPKVVFPTVEPHYTVTPAQITTSFTASENRLNRIDLYASNPDLKSTDTFTFTFKDARGTTLHTLPFSGSNAGDPTLLRIDLPVIEDSKGKEYTLIITKLYESNRPFKLGMDGNNSTTPLFRQQYIPDMSFPIVIQKTMSRFSDYIIQLPLVFILLHTIILYLLLPIKKLTWFPKL